MASINFSSLKFRWVRK